MHLASVVQRHALLAAPDGFDLAKLGFFMDVEHDACRILPPWTVPRNLQRFLADGSRTSAAAGRVPRIQPPDDDGLDVFSVIPDNVLCEISAFLPTSRVHNVQLVSRKKASVEFSPEY